MHGRPPPPDPAHADHDALLIAQYAARDPLRPDQVAEADRLVSSCRECAGLAADLGAIAHAVATEPVPPRRRDFRIDAATAEAIRGNALQRFLRRVARPETARLRPLAAGVMSIGLVMVVAGTIIPAAEDGLVLQQSVIEADGLRGPGTDEAPLAVEDLVGDDDGALELLTESFGTGPDPAASLEAVAPERRGNDAADGEPWVDAPDSAPGPAEAPADGRLESSLELDDTARKARRAEPEAPPAADAFDDADTSLGGAGARQERDRAEASDAAGFADDVAPASEDAAAESVDDAANGAASDLRAGTASDAGTELGNEAGDAVGDEPVGQTGAGEANAPTVAAATAAPAPAPAAAASPTSLDALRATFASEQRSDDAAVEGAFREAAPEETVAVTSAPGSDSDLVGLLVPLGILLALGGLGLIVLIGIARRAEPDPLGG